jgi:hypothetical protein
MENFKKAKQYWAENPMTPDTLEQAQKLYSQSLSADRAGTHSESSAPPPPGAPLNQAQ